MSRRHEARGGRRRARRGPRPVVLVVGALAVVGVGFALGFVGGIVLQDPSLFFAHMAGRTKTVALGPGVTPPDAGAQGPGASPSPNGPVPVTSPSAGAPAGASSVSSEPPQVGPVSRPESPSAAPPPPAPSTRASTGDVGAPPPGGGFAVQVGAFGDAGAADRLVGKLRNQGFRAYVSPAAKESEARWRVRVGPFPTQPAAEETAERLEREVKLPTWVVAESLR